MAEVKWPIDNKYSRAGSEIIVKDFQDLDNLDTTHDNVIVISDGWENGRVAAILRGGTNARAVLEVLASSGIKNIEIIHLEEKIPQLEDVFLASVVMPAQALFDNVTVTWRRENSVYDLVKSIGDKYTMLFFGAPLTCSEIVPFYQKIKENYSGKVAVVRGQPQDIEVDENDEINKWVRERTFYAGDFSLLSVLKSSKKSLNKKIAVLLPSLNEERTVGNVIRTALEVRNVGLIDEVILIDSASTDNTVEIAKSFGIPVYIHQEIHPELGSYVGKGEAMFKSTFTTDADILVWVDTDIESITPRFFYGLLGPMLTNPVIKFSKGYFARPVRVGTSGIELGGGRVTEILAKPWINAFIPLLSGYIQPLAGTVAMYRDTFLKMRVPVNYGVEMAMLIQAVEMEGLWATCQVNLGEVVHKSKDVTGLSEMAFQILQVLADIGPMQGHYQKQDILRRVYSENGHFEIGSKRSRIVWRQFEM